MNPDIEFEKRWMAAEASVIDAPRWIAERLMLNLLACRIENRRQQDACEYKMKLQAEEAKHLIHQYFINSLEKV